MRYLLAVLLLAATLEAGIWAGPAVQLVGDSSAVICWESDDSLAGEVEYGLDEGYGRSVVEPGPAVRHEPVLADLVPDTTWHYRVICGPDTTPDRVFRTRASAGRGFRFAVYGDNQADSAAHQQVVDRMMLAAPTAELALSVGDLTENASVAEYRSFFNIERELVAGRALWPALGNHDASSPVNWSRFLVLPGNERWYTVRWGSCAVHCLDNYTSFEPASEQYEWLVDELRADSADPDLGFVLVLLHEPPYTTNRSYAGNASAREWLCPLFERYGVAVVFSGHVHAYEHSLVNGVHYINPGSAGGSLHSSWNPAQAWTVYREAGYSFVVADAAGDTLTLSGVRVDGSGFDTLQLTSPTVAVRAGGAPVVPPAALGVRANPGRGVVFELSLPRAGHARLAVYDAAGRRAGMPFAGRLPAGTSSVSWHAARAGSYVAVLSSRAVTSRQRFVVLP